MMSDALERRIRYAAAALYRGGVWSAPGVSDERAGALWKELRDALGYQPNDPNNKADVPVITNTPRAGEVLGLRDPKPVASIGARDAKQTHRDYTALRKEVVQLGAMALAFLVEIVDTENRK